MPNCSDHKNPLQRSGISQQQRWLNGLRSDYVQVDEKEYADWIVFANEFAAYLNYYDQTNTIAGDWRPFFSKDISAVLGTIAIQRAAQYQLSVADKLNALQIADSSSDVNALKKQLGHLFNTALSFSDALNRVIYSLPKDMLLKSVIENLIKVKLQPALHRLLSYYKAGSPTLIVEEVTPGEKIMNYQLRTVSVIIAEGLPKIWWQPKNPEWANWNAYYTSVPADASIYGIEPEEYRKLAHIANHNLFKTVLNEYLTAFSKIVNEAGKQLLQTLENWPIHPAHYALFLSFLKLFRQSRNHINTLTQRHLDFYYKEVLQLKNKPQQPNHAHIVIELAKQTTSYSLKKGTLFKAGKDSLGKDVFYEMDREVVFNKAAIGKLMAVYKGGTADSYGMVNNAGRLFAASAINSADGIGGALKTNFGEWHPLVNKLRDNSGNKVVAMPKAMIGFAIASHYLYLSEGERMVYLRLATDAAAHSVSLHTLQPECYITTEKGWHKIASTSWSNTFMLDATPADLLSFTLEGDVPPITAYNAAVHGGTFNVNVPLLKIYLTNTDTSVYNYDSFSKVAVSKIEVEVQVGLNADSSTPNEKGLKQLVVQNDGGVLDASKPFQPFGPQPRNNASLIIGNKELFSKKGASYRFKLEWANLTQSSGDMDFDPTYPNTVWAYPSANLRYLQKGVWGTSEEIQIFNSNAAQVVFPSSMKTVPDAGIVSHTEAYKAFDNASIGGYLKLSLTQDFGHIAYQQALTNYLIAKAANPASTASPPVEPYTPLVQSITLSYKAAAKTELTNVAAYNSRVLQFFHLYPFGEAEQHKAISGSNPFLLPQFVHADAETGTTIDHQGEFYIGLTDISPQQSVHILIQVLDGTTDPLVEKPDEHIHWSYLSKNQWKPFEKTDVADATNQLVQSGIVSFAIPADASTNNSILPAGHIWIRLSIEKNPGAISKLLAVLTQAALVTWKPMQNAADFLSKALPAGTISKLKDPLAAIKKVEQPYPAFGGRPIETDAHFYLRVSERLRHRARAITIWDYEHVVLEAFPQIHKVKCLNHTQIDEGIYDEVRPGYVSIITIPVLDNRNDADPLKPYTNKNLLMEIESYLKKKTSCHVNVRVRNPQFEQVRLKFMLRLMPGYLDFNFYRDQLKEEITRFLTPWAFQSGLDVEFGGKIHKSVLINFIEERPYVDYITNVELLHKISESTPESDDADVIEASTARSILVSAPAPKHDIGEIDIDETISVEVCAHD